ncbi:Uncharacterised protein [uncultured archaeon]|nr:Uncharacterised protein [uncultured archaeon]
MVEGAQLYERTECIWYRSQRGTCPTRGCNGRGLVKQTVSGNPIETSCLGYTPHHSYEDPSERSMDALFKKMGLPLEPPLREQFPDLFITPKTRS